MHLTPGQLEELAAAGRGDEEVPSLTRRPGQGKYGNQSNQ